jgi:putative DNA methylase
LNKAISDSSNSKVVAIIENAKKIAYDSVIPIDFDNYFWRELTNAEKFYIKGIESEKHGNYQIGTYQEFARGFSIGGYSQLMASERANSARLKTPFEMADRSLNDVPDFQGSLMRTVFEGIYVAIKNDMNPSKGLDFIKNDISNYWDKREMIQQILSFLVDINDISNMQEHWADSAKMADALLTVVKHDSI